MRASWLVVLVCGAAAAQDFKPAKVLATQIYQRPKTSSTAEGVQIGATSVEMNLLTVVLDGYEITCEFETTADGVSAIELAVGADVPATLERARTQKADDHLLIKWSDNSVVTANVIRRKKAPRDRQAAD